MPEETKEQETASDQDNEQENLTSGDSTEKTDTEKTGDSEGEAFDAASYEESFGLPADTLKGVEDAKGALNAIREYTDKTLSAGLSAGGKVDLSDGSEDAGVVEGAKSAAEDAARKTVSKNPEVDALRAEITEIKSDLAKRDKQAFAERSAAIDSRIQDEIDSWSSPMYGTSKARSFTQAKAVKEFKELVNTQVIGFQAQGKMPPAVEKVLRQVRSFHDEKFNPTPAKSNGNAQLGSPGTGSRSVKANADSDKAPKNIHEALMSNSY